MSGRRATKAKLILVFAGLSLLIVSVGADWIGIGGTSGFGKRQVAMLLVSLSAIVIGGGWVLVGWLQAGSTSLSQATRNSKLAHTYCQGGGIVALGIGSIVVVEIVLSAGFFVSDTFFTKDKPKVGVSAYDLVDYDVDLLKREFAESIADLAYHPYTIWSRRPYEGELINIDEAGDRVTRNNSTRDDALEVWMFGGSTTWGSGAPDGETIASHLAKLLNEWGVDSAARNYGEKAYVSTQELFYLQLKLQSGPAPAVVLFYDGVNDSRMSTRAPNEPRAHFRIETIRAKMEKPDRGIAPEIDPPAIVRATGFSRFAFAIIGDGESPEADDQARLVRDYTTDGVHATEEIRLYAETAISIMLANYQLVEAIGEGYGFLPLFFLQPSLLSGRRVLSPPEQKILEEALLGETILIRSVIGDAHRKTAQENGRADRVYDLIGAFDGVVDSVFVDPAHITGPGNEVVANQIFEILQREVCGDPLENASTRTQEQFAVACADGS